jgi:hypothetical protein
MLKITAPAILCAALAIGFATAPAPLLARQSKDAAAAPLPAPILSAKKAFVSYAGEDSPAYKYSGGTDRTYNEFYAAMKSSSRFDLVGAPADADLILEIGFTCPIESVSVTDGAFVSGGSSSAPQFRLVVLDPKTHVVLWTFIEHVSGAVLQGTRDKNFDQALAAIADDMKNLSSSAASAPGGAGK